MIKLALIDNGIPYHMRNNRNQRIVHKSFLASKCDPSEYKDDKSFHGAVCVGIITSICSDIELWDLSFLLRISIKNWKVLIKYIAFQKEF